MKIIRIARYSLSMLDGSFRVRHLSFHRASRKLLRLAFILPATLLWSPLSLLAPAQAVGSSDILRTIESQRGSRPGSAFDAFHKDKMVFVKIVGAIKSNQKDLVANALSIAQPVIAMSPGEIHCVVCRFYDSMTGQGYFEVVIDGMDNVALGAKTTTIEDLMQKLPQLVFQEHEGEGDRTHKYAAAAEKAMSNGSTDKAQCLIYEGLDEIRSQGNPSLSEMIDAAEDLASTCMTQQRLDQATLVFAKLLSCCEKLYGADSAQLAPVLNQWAQLNFEQGRFEDCRRTLERALAVSLAKNGEQGVDVADTMDGLGRLSFKSGDLLQAETYFFKAVQLKEKSLNPYSLSLANTLERLGDVYLRKGNGTDASKYYRRAKAIYDHDAVAPERSIRLEFAKYKIINKRIEENLAKANRYAPASSSSGNSQPLPKLNLGH